MRSLARLILILALGGAGVLAGCDREIAISQKRGPRIIATDLEVGIGPEIEEGRRIAIRYKGELPSGEVFLDTFEERRPHEFIVGDGTIIQAVDLAVRGMRQGGVRRVKAPPELHWGREGYAGIVPPNTRLTFTVEVVAVR